MLGCQNTALAILYTKHTSNAIIFLRNSQKGEKVYKKTKMTGKSMGRIAKRCVFAQNTDVRETKYIILYIQSCLSHVFIACKLAKMCRFKFR